MIFFINFLIFVPQKLILFFDIITPKSKNIHLISAGGGVRYSGNSKALFEYYLKNKASYPDLELYWAVPDLKSKKNIPTKYSTSVIRLNTIKGLFYFLRAKRLIYSHGISDFKIFKILTVKSAYRRYVCLWHARTIKADGYLSPLFLESHKKTKSLLQFNRTNFFISTSKVNSFAHASAIGQNIKRRLISGYPMNDIIVNWSKSNTKSLDVKNILYAPTYRDKEFLEDNVDVFTDFDRLNEVLAKQSIHVIINAHPNDCIDYKREVADFSQFSVNTTESLERLFFKCDLLISDYSGIVHDWIIMEKPVLFYMPDIDLYLEKRDLTFEFNEIFFPGPICRNANELINKLSEPSKFIPIYEDGVKNLNQIINCGEKGLACKIILNKLNQDN